MAKLIVGVNDLATVNPELAKEWDYEKNEKKPQDYTAGSGIKVWWLCEKGHSWQVAIYSRVSGRGCPICSNKQVCKGINDLATLKPNLAKEWNYDKNDTLTPSDVTIGSNRTVWWICSKGHEWKTKIAHRTRGSNCPICSNKQVLSGYNDLATLYPKLVTEWNYNRNGSLKPSDVGVGERKVWWICEKGHEWQALIYTRTKGVGCPICSNKQVLSGYNDLATTDPILAKQWNYSKNIGVTPKDVTKGSAKKFWWVCEKGHEWQSTIAHRTTMHRGCPYCSGRLPIKGETDLLTLYPSLASEWNYEKNGNLLPSEVTTGTPSKVWWLCKEGHEWIAGIAHRTKEGTNCPYCSGSKTERLVYAYLKELQIPFTAEKKFEQDIKVKWFPFDVWISSKRLIIEPDGKQHFTDKIPYFEDNVPFQERRRRDNAKNEFCLKYKIPILRIPYTYKSDTEKEKIKSMIKDFIETRKIPQEIIDFYEQYKENNNYAEIARKLNELN